MLSFCQISGLLLPSESWTCLLRQIHRRRMLCRVDTIHLGFHVRLCRRLRAATNAAQIYLPLGHLGPKPDYQIPASGKAGTQTSSTASASRWRIYFHRTVIHFVTATPPALDSHAVPRQCPLMPKDILPDFQQDPKIVQKPIKHRW